MQYNIIPYENGLIKSVLRSWILAQNDIILNFNRNYNTKEALLKFDSSTTEKNLM
jgi:hypothetical protein